MRYLDRERNSRGKYFDRRLVLPDRDRIQSDRQAGRDALAAASRHELEVVFQDPDMEGLLLRLTRGTSTGEFERAMRRASCEKSGPRTASR